MLRSKPADPDCKFCHGTGEVIDLVPRPFGPGMVQMPSACECTWEETDDDNP